MLHIAKLGVIDDQPHARTTGITGLGVPAGADATVGSATTLLLTCGRALAPHIGLEFVLGVPPKINAEGSGTVAFLGAVLSAKNVAPTVLLNDHFGDANSMLRPCLGAGSNHTRFTGASTPCGWQVSLRDSRGWAVQAGLDAAPVHRHHRPAARRPPAGG